MLLYPPMNELLKNVPSRYMLVNLVANRARKIANEADSISEPLSEKAVTLAIREVASGTLQIEELEK